MREPSTLGPGKEPLLARWLQNQRSYYKRTGKINTEYEDALAKEGFFGILRRCKKEATSNQTTRNIISWVASNGREPVGTSTDPVEAHIGALLERRRSSPTIFPSDALIASDAGFPNLLSPYGREDHSNKSALSFCLWVLGHGKKLPDRRSPNREESSLANWYWNRRSVLNGNLAGTSYESDRKMLETFGLAHLLSHPTQGKTACPSLK